MQTVPNRSAVRRRIKHLQQRPAQTKPSLLSFFLFDERSSHQAVQSFVDDEYHWLDSLARSSRIVILFFRESPASNTNTEDDVLVIDGSAKSTNPSLEVAAKFGIRPDQLPGIVFFRDLDLDSKESAQGIYWRLPIESFQEDRGVLENELARLFAMVQTARSRSHGTDSMFNELKSELVKMQRTQAAQPFMTLLGRGLMRVVTYPGKLIEAIVIAFGEGVGQAFAKTYGGGA